MGLHEPHKWYYLFRALCFCVLFLCVFSFEFGICDEIFCSFLTTSLLLLLLLLLGGGELGLE